MKRPLTDAELKTLARETWDSIESAYHWEDGFGDAYADLELALRKARNGVEPAGGVEPPASGVRNQRSTD